METRGAVWEVLPGLPPYGDPALPFSDTGLGMHREGLVVRFRRADGSSWTGNFQRGFGESETVLLHPNEHEVIVLAGGTAYVVDPQTCRLSRTFGADIEFAAQVPGSSDVLLGNGLWFERVARGRGWQTRRISWDGMRNLHFVDDATFCGEAYGLDDDWHSFTLDLREGSVTGGSYDGPDV